MLKANRDYAYALYFIIFELTHNVYIGIGRTCMFIDHLNSTAFNKVFVAQLVEHKTSDLRTVDSSPTIGIFFI